MSQVLGGHARLADVVVDVVADQVQRRSTVTAQINGHHAPPDVLAAPVGTLRHHGLNRRSARGPGYHGDVSPRLLTQGAQEPTEPGALMAKSMAPQARRRRRDLVDELGAAGTRRARGAGQSGGVHSMSAQGGVDALSSGQAGCGGIIADRMVEPVHGAGKRGHPQL